MMAPGEGVRRRPNSSGGWQRCHASAGMEGFTQECAPAGKTAGLFAMCMAGHSRRHVVGCHVKHVLQALLRRAAAATLATGASHACTCSHTTSGCWEASRGLCHMAE